MPWSTPTLRDVRSLVRDNVRASLPGADASVPNSVLRVMSDAQGALCHLTLQYIDWLALQLLPDTSEVEWLDRHADIWLVNADGSTGRKMAALAYGFGEFQGILDSMVIPKGSQLTSGVAETEATGGAIGYETMEDITVSSSVPVVGKIRALDAGSFGNLPPGTSLSFSSPIPGVATSAVVAGLTGGTDVETDDDLRARVLFRIQQPPMGGDANDYVAWTLAVPGVTRAWCSPLEMGMGTVTVRFMMDGLRADNDGFPLGEDIEQVRRYLDVKRPVAVKDFFVVAPIPEPIDFAITQLTPDLATTRAAIIESVDAMIKRRCAPASAENGVAQAAQTIYAAWVSEAIMAAPGVESFHLWMEDHLMPSPGHMAVLGSISYVV
jgi:uncharacterized phage protein gp47/JayE